MKGLIGLSLLALLSPTIMIFFYQKYLADPRKERLYFYFNQGISEMKLYGFMTFVNLFLLTLVILFS